MTAPLPPWVLTKIQQRQETGWTGKIGLSMRAGKVIEIEYLEREREPESR